jgi:hypothetical protein
MKVYWKDGALNVKPETEEDGAITSAILFAFGDRSNLTDVVLKATSDSRIDDTNHQTIVGVNMPLDGIVECVSGGVGSDKPFGKQNPVSID